MKCVVACSIMVQLKRYPRALRGNSRPDTSGMRAGSPSCMERYSPKSARRTRPPALLPPMRAAGAPASTRHTQLIRVASPSSSSGTSSSSEQSIT
eukprot:scaffold5303_cov36-Phaeocystis_antarctica.AAC.1